MNEDCPTCGHTLAAVSTARDFSRRVTMCSRCGTVIVSERCHHSWKLLAMYVPKLVGRCQQFEEMLFDQVLSPLPDAWRRLGIYEAIHRPEDRK